METEKENMNIRSIRSSPAFVPGTDEPEKIYHHLRDTKSYATAQGNTSNTNTLAGHFNQVSMVEKARKNKEIGGSFSSHAVLQSLVATKLRNLGSMAFKGAIMQGIDASLAKEIEKGFLAAGTGFKHIFFCLKMVTLADIVHHDLMKNLIHYGLKPWTQIQALTNRLLREVCNHPSLTKRVLKITSPIEFKGTFTRTKYLLVWNTSKLIFDGVQRWLYNEKRTYFQFGESWNR